MFDIEIKSIAHKDQRYDTVGDWWWEPTQDHADKLCIRISKMSDWRYEALVAFHELCEVLICKWKGIRQEDVDAFDQAFEAQRKPGEVDEPGDDPSAPYHFEHAVASACERVLAVALGVNWKEYDDVVMACE